MREEIEPRVEPHEAHLRKAFLAAGCRPALAAHLGEQLFVRWEIAQAAYEPANIPPSTQVSRLAADYMRLLGTAELDAGSETITIMTAQARLTDPDAGSRRGAWLALTGWLSDHAPAIHEIYDRQIALRHQMAQNLGEPNFIPLAYKRLARTDYGPAEVALFRDEIRRHVVPVMARLRDWQARALGTERVAPYDADYYPGLTLNAGVVPVDGQLDRAQALFERLDPRLGAHVRTMIARGLIDLPARPGKATGAYCMVFEDTGEAAIFCNSTGNALDIITLTHELGHAMQAWESMSLPAMDVRSPGMEAAEVHSMGMELLALRELGALFDDDDAGRYRRLLFVTVLNRIPYMAVVDAFQHWVYEHPTHSHAQREAKWDELWRQFLPGVDETEFSTPHRTRWMRQAHLFKHPFYYIDYALAETCALQLWQLAERDHGAAMAAYLKLCSLGGTKPLVAFCQEAGLQSPFTPGILGPLMERVAAELGI